MNGSHKLLPYGVAIGSTAIALLLTLWLAPVLTPSISVLFFVAITITTWYGGLQPGLVAIVLSTLAIDRFFALPAGQVAHPPASHLIRLATFSLVALVIHLLSHNLKDSKRRVEQLSQKLLEESSDRLQIALTEAQTSQVLLQHQLEQQRLVMEMSQRIRRSLNLQDILQTTVDEIRHSLQVDRVIIFQFTQDWGGKVTVESVGDEAFAILQAHIYDSCIGKQYIEPFKQGLVTAKADIYNANISPCHVKFLAQFQVRANLVVPILKNNELWGLMAAHHCSSTRQWQEVEIDLLRQIASQVSIALQQAELFKQVQTELAERQQAESALQTRETLLRLFVQYAPAGIAMLDREMRYVMASQRWIDDYHLDSIESLIARSHYEIFPEIPKRWRQIHQRCLAGAIEKCDEDLWTRADGTPQWLSWEIRPWQTTTGEIGGIIIFSVDVTKRKQAEEALRESRNQIQRQLAEIETIYQSAPIGLNVLDPHFRFVRINQRLAEINGFPVEAHLGRTIRELLPDLADTTEQLLGSILETGEPLLNVEVAGETPAQPSVKRTWIESFLPLKEGDRIIGISTVCEEITERKRVEEALQQSEARLRLAQVASNSAVWDWDIRTNTLFWSPEYYQLYGLDPAIEPSYENWLRCIHPDDREKTNWQTLQVLEGQALEDRSSEIRVEFRVLRTGEIHWFGSIGQLFRDDAGEPIRLIGITLDITQQKQTEIALQTLNAALEQRVMERTAELTALNDRLLMAYIEQAQTQESLRESEERRRLALDLTHIGFWDYHLGSGKVIWNDNHFTLLGLTPGCCEPTYELWCRHVHPDDLIWVEPQFLASIQNKTDYTAEYRMIHQDGSIHWIMARAQAVYDRTGQPLRSLGVVLDITDRKSAEAALQQQTRQEWLRWSITQAIRQSLDLNAILNTAVDRIRQTLQADRVAVYRFRPDWSGEFVAESVGKDWIELVDAEVPNVWEDTYLQQTQGGRFRNYEPFVIPDIYTAGLQSCHIELLEQFQVKAYAVIPIFSGSILWGLLAVYQNATTRNWQIWEIELLQQIASQLSIALQQSQLYSHLQAELQERKQREAILRETERRWRSLLNNVQLVVVGLDLEGHIEYANPFFLKLTGYQWEEISGQYWFDLFLAPTHQSPTQLVFQKILTDNLHFHYQNPIVTKGGEERMIAWSNTVLQNTSEKPIGVISIGEDITERSKVDRIKAEFISVVSHELRTPLTSMQAALSLLNDKIIDPLSEEGETTIQIATEGTDRLVRLVNDILDLERLESGKVRLEKHLYPINDLVNTAIAQMQEMANQSGIILEANPCHWQGEVDADRLLQVLTNLLSNAIKFSSPGSIVQLAVELDPSEEMPSYVRFTVRDEGRGIPADKLESIFDRFQQVDASDSRQRGGTGLGLAICRSIVQQHGGEIWVESTMGQGSQFYFTIPRWSGENQVSNL